jgi:hypothetical protein
MLRCVGSKWWKAKKPLEAEVELWSVLAVFKKLTAGGKLPKRLSDALQDGEVHKRMAVASRANGFSGGGDGDPIDSDDEPLA